MKRTTRQTIHGHHPTDTTVILPRVVASTLERIGNFLAKLLMCSLLLISSDSQGADTEFDENQMKALYLYNFAKHTKFSKHRNPANETQLIVGIYGEISFTSELALIDGKKVSRKSITVKKFPSLTEAKDQSQILFIGDVEEGFLEVLKQLQGSSILTVSDAKNFARRGGMIEMYLESNIRKKQRLMFDVNLSSLKDEKLSLNSRVLKLANKRIR